MHLSAIQPECQCLYHIQVSIQCGEGSFYPKKIKMYIVQITIEKALLECQINLQWSKMASDTTLYNLKTQIFLGDNTYRSPSYIPLYYHIHTYTSAPPYITALHVFIDI